MVVLKFGGSSVGTPERVSDVCSIILDAQKKYSKVAVVVSAFSGITDQLLQTALCASEGQEKYREYVQSIAERHEAALKILIAKPLQKEMQTVLAQQLDELRNVANGIFLIREATPRTLDFIASFGERLSALLVAGALRSKGAKAEFCDARQLVVTNDAFMSARPDFFTTNANIKKFFSKTTALQVITGFIGSTPQGHTTTLGRGGSDYTGAIFGAALKAKEIQIWTDVNGVMTADPRKVPHAQTLDHLSYEEAMEMSHFGAKVIHPPTIQPALIAGIPLRIMNTFNPTFPGTLITKENRTSPFAIKGISSMGHIALLTIAGAGMVGVVGMSQRLFGAMARAKVSAILITQASSEHSICIAIEPAQADAAVLSINDEFKYEIQDGLINPVVAEGEQSIVAIVGSNMKNTPGISGKLFSALGEHGVNIRAIAQGSSELNISCVIAKKDEAVAIRAIHDKFFAADTHSLNVFVAGTGTVGTELLKQIARYQQTSAPHQPKITVVGIANSKGMVFDPKGIAMNKWQTLLANSTNKATPAEIQTLMTQMTVSRKVFVDATSSNLYTKLYAGFAHGQCSVVTPNKLLNAGPYKEYQEVRTAATANGVQFLYEANVGAGLPIIKTIQDLVTGGDTVREIHAVLSGTLAYLFDKMMSGTLYSEAIKEAHKLGYTEPDPRDDLSGADVARKALILAREVGAKTEIERVSVVPVMSEKLAQARTVEDFFKLIRNEDEYYSGMRFKAVKAAKRLSYIAVIKFDGKNAKIKVSPEMIGPEHPCYHAKTNNVVLIYSTYYHTSPLVIQGPGAGPQVTAHGVLADILRCY
jgi:aspartokinase/homoserine dehydrogenase 1